MSTTPESTASSDHATADLEGDFLLDLAFQNLTLGFEPPVA